VVHTAEEPPNHGRICLAMIGCTMKSRKADRKIVTAYGTTALRAAGAAAGSMADIRFR
jgi:hypothetical protein